MKHPIDAFKHTSKTLRKYGMNEYLRRDLIRKPKESVSYIPQDYTNDVILGEGLEYMLNRLREEGNLDKKTFIIVEEGMPHIPYGAIVLRRNDIEPFIWLEKREDVTPTMYYSNFSYFADEFKKFERGNLVARVFDTHSSIDRSDLIPDSEKLKEKGIERVVFLMEGTLALGSEYNTDEELDSLFSGERSSLASLYRSLNKAGFKIKIYEIDPRSTEHSYEKMLKFVKENDEILAFLEDVWGQGRADRNELVKILEDFKKSWF
ncbi:MAG: hypothetical protein J7K73_00685 [Nanoarchaeota archaeon]|nr:hypothetical protein [Nanoarchaeota archaeon]